MAFKIGDVVIVRTAFCHLEVGQVVRLVRWSEQLGLWISDTHGDHGKACLAREGCSVAEHSVELAEMADILEMESVPGNPVMIQAIKCRMCKQSLAEDDIRRGNMNGLPVALQAHFGIHHGLDVRFHHCDDPKCLKEG